MVVKSPSMEPTFYQGDLIIIKKCDPSKLVVGDIVTFHTIIENEYALNTHRIIEIDGTGDASLFVTKGDNNPISDIHRISTFDVVGKYVTRVPVLGKVISFLSGGLGFVLVIVLPMVLFLIYQVYHLIMVSMKLKKAMATENAEAAAQAELKIKNEAAAKNEAMLREAEKAKAEAEAARAEAKRIKEEAEKLKAASNTADEKKSE
jgi:signal peptidase